MRIVSAAMLFQVALLSGCGGKGTTEPSTPSSITGTWLYSASNVMGAVMTCNISVTTLTIQRSGTAVSGSASGGAVSCSGSGGTYSESLDGDSIANGSADDNGNLSFDIGSSNVHNDGWFNGSDISGNVFINVDLGPPTGAVTMQGVFVAIRK
jgi:hypothetical protein